MSETQVQTCFRENLCRKFSQLDVSPPQPDSPCSSPSSEPTTSDTLHSSPGDVLFRNNVAFFDFKLQRLTYDQPHMWGDGKPPTRFQFNPCPSKSPQELLQNINEKLQKNASRREQFIQDTVLKSRRLVEKVQKVRERLSKMEQETAQNMQNLLKEKRQAADKTRQKALQTKLNSVRKRLDHVKVVKNKKLFNNSLDQSSATFQLEDTQSPASSSSTTTV